MLFLPGGKLARIVRSSRLGGGGLNLFPNEAGLLLKVGLGGIGLEEDLPSKSVMRGRIGIWHQGMVGTTTVSAEDEEQALVGY